LNGEEQGTGPEPWKSKSERDLKSEFLNPQGMANGRAVDNHR
jgi:hypothetical protein